MNPEFFIQPGLLTLTAASAYCLTHKKVKLGCILGLASQPFWMFTTVMNEQWGIFACAWFYTWTYIDGMRKLKGAKNEVSDSC
jgi:hypothetical protein